jgi:hypothetical protein
MKCKVPRWGNTEEQWNFFTFSWQQYKANIEGQEKERLGGCLGDTVAGMVFARHSDKRYKELTEEELLKKAKQLFVKSRNKLVHRLKPPWCRGGRGVHHLVRDKVEAGGQDWEVPGGVRGVQGAGRLHRPYGPGQPD